MTIRKPVNQGSGNSGSIVVFTLHKSASVLLYKLCDYLSMQSGIQCHSPNKEGSGIDARSLLLDRSIWRTRKGCFAPVRAYVDIPDIDDMQIILHLRDPRDVLVSMFYSYCFIHEGELEKNSGYRKEVAQRGIDRFVLAMSRDGGHNILGDYGTGGHLADITGNLLKKYTDYIDNILPRSNTIFLKYEQMVLDFHSWLEKFVEPFPLQNKAALVDDLVSRQDQMFPPPRTKDVMQHTRHVTPGDHRNKLKAETIEELDDIFAEILDALDYQK